ncbi:hypothetical protein TWF569_010421 [Orbilia oligospora]|uniref:CorA-like transporter domain-containing protein n=1 Tax=Orbilia oligospora TaxID=2813651 RepID=A0A7C8JGZ8_ORBOL|nr:hypothetical protein TWF706_006171 [Orbilia oligospora]KAF3112027.1 hypothetical protein TWF102_005775 [Orbilia oligospora]KAF3113258.1 hypothetical protein TWF103_002425 [Orbilia oligospora]KAF3133734.1 hypothetical protein TWF569_010421 [Orbilia oligospora]KAF3147455.1 hypothetical protein TWF594_002675 [Orbilia oligospora]
MKAEREYELPVPQADPSTYPKGYAENERLVSTAQMKDYSDALSRAAQDQLCLPDHQQSRLKCFHFKRLESENSNKSSSTLRGRAGSGEAKDADEINITSITQLKEHLEEIHTFAGQQTVLYCFDARNSWSRLQLTEEMIRTILGNYRLNPKFIEILITFGERITATEESFASYYDKIHLSNPFKTVGPSQTVNSDLEGYEIGYILKYAARHNRDRPKDPFVIRQTGVNQICCPQRQLGVWILLHAATGLKDRLRSLFEKFNREPGNLALQIEIHLVIFQYCGEGWRPYIAYLESFAEELTDRGFYSQAISRPEVDSLQAEISDVRELHFLSDKLRRLVQILSLNIHLARQLAKFAERLGASWSSSKLTSPDTNLPMKSLVAGINEQIFSLEVSKSRVDALLDRIKDISVLVRQVLDIRNEASNRSMSMNLREISAAGVEENQHMRMIAAKGAKDTKMVAFITIITAIFLPATFIASIFGTNFFDFDGDTKELVVGTNFWIYFVFAGGITTLIFLGWVIWKIRLLNRLVSYFYRAIHRRGRYPFQRTDEEKGSQSDLV